MTFARNALRIATATSVALVQLTVLPTPPARADYVREAQWYLAALRVPEAQQITEGLGVVVAVVDSGVSAGHPDLSGAVLPGKNILEDGGDGRQDLKGHGTAMAGIIAARGRGGDRGLLGMAPKAKIMPVRPTGDTALVVSAIKWAVAHGAKVINLSISVPASQNLQRAVSDASAADVVVIGSAGNGGDDQNKIEYPAGYPEVVAVGAVGRSGEIASFSQRGPQVDIVAPGIEIPTLDPPTDYARSSGTSDAAAIVSGAAALIRAKYPNLTAAQVVDRLTSTAKDLGPKGRDDAYGHGELDLMAALTAKLPSEKPTTPPPAQATAPVPVKDSAIPPTVIIGAGLALLLGAAVAAAILFNRSRSS